MPRDDRPNVLLIVSEDHGPHLGCHGDPNARTPTLDRLAAEGTRFATHHTTCAVCSPGRASVLTGLHAHENGQINLATHGYGMYRPFHNLVSILKAQGYRTGRLGKLHVQPTDAFPFDFVWQDRERISFGHRDVHRTAEVAGAHAAEEEGPLFLYACFADAHLPLLHQSHGEPAQPRTGDEIEPPDFCQIDAPHMRDRLAGYYNCLERLDTGVARLWEKLERQSGRETILLFTSDHGQQFIRGKVTCYQGGLHVPMLMHAPRRVPVGVVRREPTSHLDVLPTVLDLLGIEPPAHRAGRSLLPLARGEANAWHQHVIGEWSGSPRMWFPQRSIFDGRYKLIVNPLAGERANEGARAYLPPGWWETSLDEDDLAAAPPAVRAALERAVEPPPEELYDLDTDPTELHDLSGVGDMAPVRDRLRQALSAWQKERADPMENPETFRALTDLHDRVERAHYGNGRMKPDDPAAVGWNYGRWLDPGITK
jgi:N-sulfoglucosamine sulfohydrolase